MLTNSVSDERLYPIVGIRLLDKGYKTWYNSSMNDYDKIETLGGSRRVVYIMRISDVKCHGNPLYKIGVTTFLNGYERLDTLSKQYNCEYDIIAWVVVDRDAFFVERQLLHIGDKIPFMVGKASTEFRSWDDAQLESATQALRVYSLFHRL